MAKLALKAARVFTPLQELRDGVVLIEGERIEAVGRQSNVAVPEDAKVVDLGDRILCPGFIDVHNHGGFGHSASEGAEATKAVARGLAKTGTTGWFPTVRSVEAVQGVAQAAREGTGGTSIPGIHCEGPFQAPKNIPGMAHEELPLADIDLYH